VRKYSVARQDRDGTIAVQQFTSDTQRREMKMAQQHYSGGCHCGALRFTVDLDLDQTITCNCSICRKRGLILGFAPVDRFNLSTGEGAAQEYLFNKHVIRHQFCRVCGVEAYSYGAMPDGTRMVAVNARCLDGVDPAALKPTPYDGANH
jgi:hypothetical protein